MRGRRLVALIVIAVGLVWFLQGINILPGSFMTGDSKWAIIGGVMVLVGAVMAVMPAKQS